MANTALAKRLAWFAESTQGTGPIDGPAWVSSGNPIRFIGESLDPSPFVQSMIEDERNQYSVLAYDPMIHGIKGGIEFGFETYLHGSADTSRADNDTTTLTDFQSLLTHAFGARRAAQTGVAVADGDHTASQVELVDATGLAAGDWIGLPDSTGVVHHRRIMTIAAGSEGQVCTLHRALPFTPQDGDIVRGLACIYISEAPLVNSGTGPTTLSYLIEVGLAGTTNTWEANGCVSFVTGITLTRNAVARIVYNTLVASFSTPEEAPTPSWAATPTDGEAGLAIGPDTSVFLQARGTATENTVHVPEFSVNPGIVRVPIDTLTTTQTGMIGRSHYSLARNPCEITMTVVPQADSNWAAFNASTLQHLQYERRSTDGLGWSLYFPRCQLTSTPANAMAEIARAQSFTLRALDDLDAPESAAPQWSSRMQIVLA